MSKIENVLPKSVADYGVGLCGLGALFIGFGIVNVYRPFAAVEHSALALLAFSALAMTLYDLIVQKVHRRASTGLDFSYNSASLSRSAIKYLGLLASFAFIGFFYWLFPEYDSKFLERYWTALKILVPFLLLAAIPYIYVVDRHMTDPKDSYWQMGQLMLGKTDGVSGSEIGQHLLAWVIKGFFLPLMFLSMCNHLTAFSLSNFSSLVHSMPTLYGLTFDFLYFIDVALVSIGYIMAFRLFDSHSRSSEPTMMGWVVCLFCYAPFNEMHGRYFSYRTGVHWSTYFADTPVLHFVWGAVIIALTVCYVWATVIFGNRFSNLSHRGIITNGPYRYTKHPAYISKNLSWWMMSMPFMYIGPPGSMTRLCLMLIGINLIYTLRALTEERHLSRDPDYVRYALWMEDHGIFRFIQRVPLLRLMSYRSRLHRAVSPASISLLASPIAQQ